MKVSTFGAQFSTSKHFNLKEVFESLTINKVIDYEHNGLKRYVFSEKLENSDIYCGLIITAKNHKKFVELMKGNGPIKINTRSASANSELAEFNFFYINSKTQRGVYQHYHNSASLNTFGAILKNRQLELYNERLKEVKAKDADNYEKIKKDLKPQIRWSFLTTPENLDVLLEKFKRIKSLECEVTSLAAKDKIFGPIENIAKKKRRIFTFDPKFKSSLISPLILNLFNNARNSIGKASVNGIDENNEIATIFLENNLEKFSENDFDSIAEKMNEVNTDDVKNSPFMKSLQITYEENKTLFEIPITKNQ